MSCYRAGGWLKWPGMAVDRVRDVGWVDIVRDMGVTGVAMVRDMAEAWGGFCQGMDVARRFRSGMG